MDDMNALEQQIEGQLNRFVGPVLPVDDTEIFAAITATQSPKWRFQSMFNATKFVVAGVIVALFGGFLLAGVLTQQQGDEVAPAVGASASPEPSSLHRVRLPAELPDDVRSGTLDTPLGPARWVHLQAGWGQNWGPPLPAREGFVLLDGEEPTMLWRSPDLIEWTSEPLPVDGRYAGLELADGTYWLSTSDPEGLWRSEDTVTWQQIDQSELVSPFPEWLDAGPRLDGPISSAGVTIVPFGFSPYITGSDLGLPDLDGTDWHLFESAEPGVFEATSMRAATRTGVHARLRFEETDTGLRAIDVSDDTELAQLDGVDLDFIERWAELGYPEESHLAIVEGDGLVPVDRPAWFDQVPGSPDQELRVFGTESGFIVYGYAPDSDLVRVWRSDDGVTWSETEPLGDDPGEPTRLHDMHPDGPNGDLEAVSWEGAWLSSDGLTWRESERLPRAQDLPQPEPALEGAVRMALGWLSLSKGELSYKRDGDDGWETTDVTELSIDIDPDVYGEFGIYAISPDTIVVPAEHEIWILTFDDLPG